MKKPRFFCLRRKKLQVVGGCPGMKHTYSGGTLRPCVHGRGTEKLSDMTRESHWLQKGKDFNAVKEP